eukprot:NODE_8105_length_532_cov_44.312629_g7052_i0.p4 GENE.NODE_8105_length_532_cov_44.312629_g7052_i0~~NODE_8105_length_532_cov_44.312629_g7052_i0.p4  ORF type:complete len:58 (-),score=3.59 NODE_8105_length_532_cov_44.312629_g7052_i0:328-501(-)
MSSSSACISRSKCHAKLNAPQHRADAACFSRTAAAAASAAAFASAEAAACSRRNMYI